jgi:outer membrane protein TolC
VAVAQANEGVAEADSRIAGLYPNPTVSVGSSTQAARLSLAATLPLRVLGQRGAALDAGRAEFAVAQLETKVSLAEVRAATAHAFVALWLAEHTASARADGAAIAERLEVAVQARVDLGSSPALEGLRVRAERLRAEMDARAAADLVQASAAELAAWVGVRFDELLRVSGDPEIPAAEPEIAALGSQLDVSPSVQRALAEERASRARATSERAELRPMMTLDVAADVRDRTLPATNYRAQLGLEVPLFNQRGPLIERQERRAEAARTQARAERARLSAALIVSYRAFAALTRRVEALSEGVVPAALAAARATEESYSLGRAPLLQVLDAERARIDAELSLVDSRAARADAWIDVERALGVP